jgi:hypothetical protein
MGGCNICGPSEKDKEHLNDLKKELDIDDHMITLEELSERYHTDLEKVFDF